MIYHCGEMRKVTARPFRMLELNLYDQVGGLLFPKKHQSQILRQIFTYENCTKSGISLP